MNQATMVLKREAAIEYAKGFRNIRYYKGNGVETPITNGDDPIFGFTCSGIDNEILRGVGLLGPYDRFTANKIFELFSAFEVKGPPQRGDFLFYGERKIGEAPEFVHMSMMIDDLHIWEAGGGSNDTDTDEKAAKRNAFVRMRPVEFRQSEISAIIRPWVPEAWWVRNEQTEPARRDMKLTTVY